VVEADRLGTVAGGEERDQEQASRRERAGLFGEQREEFRRRGGIVE